MPNASCCFKMAMSPTLLQPKMDPATRRESATKIGVVGHQLVNLKIQSHPPALLSDGRSRMMKWTLFRNESKFHSDNRRVSGFRCRPIIWRLSPMTYRAEPRSQIFFGHQPYSMITRQTAGALWGVLPICGLKCSVPALPVIMRT
jgi:hypothetical protein